MYFLDVAGDVKPCILSIFSPSGKYHVPDRYSLLVIQKVHRYYESGVHAVENDNIYVFKEVG